VGPLTRAAKLVVPAENPARAIYGLLAIGAVLAAESGRHESYVDTVLSAVIAALGYWLLHAYARMLGRRFVGGERLTVGVLTQALVHETAVLRGAAVPIGALLVAWAAGTGQETAVSIALWSVVVSLIGFELLAGLRARSAPGELALEAGVGVMLGLSVLVMRAVLHP
jgi:hypothetical protein